MVASRPLVHGAAYAFHIAENQPFLAARRLGAADL
jgi:hypothetical protein